MLKSLRTGRFPLSPPSLPPKLAFQIDRLKAALNLTANAVANGLLFVGIAVIGGVGSSLYMTEVSNPLVTQKRGPWVTWLSAGQPDADPYTKAHFARLGDLPIAANTARVYEAKVDAEGRRLYSSCDYKIEDHNPPGPGRWWSLEVFDDRGLLIPNSAQRYAFTSDTVARLPDGGYVVSLARDARPGNWLPTGGAGRIKVAFTLIDQSPAAFRDRDKDIGLPTIEKVACR